jgi:tetratricopeptide (TPR) repeat protein
MKAVMLFYFLRRGTALKAIFLFYIYVGALFAAAPPAELASARDHQDLAALNRFIAQYQQGVQANPQSTEAQYKLALANSFAAEVAMELHDKRKSEAYAEAGMDFAQKATAANANNAEYHRLLGELCGQVIPANPIFGALKYGQCARDEIDKAIQLDGRLALAFVSRGVGNYYLPSSMGGGLDTALKDFDKALALDPKLSEAYIWKGVTLRKANRNAEARQAFQKALEINPQRVWTKQQLDKTPAS